MIRKNGNNWLCQVTVEEICWTNKSYVQWWHQGLSQLGGSKPQWGAKVCVAGQQAISATERGGLCIPVRKIGWPFVFFSFFSPHDWLGSPFRHSGLSRQKHLKHSDGGQTLPNRGASAPMPPVAPPLHTSQANCLKWIISHRTKQKL